VSWDSSRRWRQTQLSHGPDYRAIATLDLLPYPEVQTRRTHLPIPGGVALAVTHAPPSGRPAVDINVAVVYKSRACAYEPVCWRPLA